MRTRIFRFVFLAVLIAGSTAWASPPEDDGSGLRGPVMGYVLDAARQAIRPVNGIPGSSLLGDPVPLPFTLAAAAFSPGGEFALAVAASDDRTVFMLRNLRGTPDINDVAGVIGKVDQVFLNGDASAAALLSSEAQQIQILRGLPASPVAGPTIDLSSITGTITALAIDKSGTKVLIGVSADYGALYLADVGAETSPRWIAGFGSPRAIALLHDDQDVIVADAAVNQITLLRNFAGTPEALLLAGERDGISAPAGLLVSPDGSKLYVANTTSRSLDIWNFATQSIETSFHLDTEPTRLTPVQGTSTFVLNDVGDHPLLLLDAPENPAVYFVPAGRDR